MSLAHSTNIVTNGLVMYYDMANTAKSFKGAPTTNLCNFNVASSGFSTDTAANLTQTANDTSVTYQGRPSRKMNALAAGYVNFYIYSYNTGVSSGTFTISCKIRMSDGSHPNQFGFTGYVYGSAGNFASLAVSYNYLGDGWYQLYWSYNGTAMTLNSLTGLSCTAPGARTFYITDYQAEALSYATGYVTNGTSRTNTQTLLDLTGTTTITANSLTYNSNNGFSFVSGSSNYLSVTNTDALRPSTELSIEYVIKGTPPSSWNQIYGYGAAAYASGNYLVWVESSGGGLHGLCRANNVEYRCTPTQNISSSVYTHVVYTMKCGDAIRPYFNGVAHPTTTALPAGTFTYNGTTSPYQAGSLGGSYFNGEIPLIKFYNRALTAAEIKQNYDAIKGRYGLS